MNEHAAASRSEPKARTLYGRRKGKKLRLNQAGLIDHKLPEVAIDLTAPTIDPRSLFTPEPINVRLEIGFGGAEHILAEATRYPAVGFIGCEPFLNGVAKLLVQMEEHSLQNIRVHHGDAREVLLKLLSASLNRVDVLYPDPWPKWRQRKRRFLSESNLTEIARVLQPGGEFRFATDIDDYAGWVLARVLKSKDWSWLESESGTSERSWQTAWPYWPGTRYEAKAFREGRPPVYFTFLRRS